MSNSILFHHDQAIRQEYAGDHNISVADLKVLVHDPYPLVRSYAYSNHNAPIEMVLEGFEDPSSLVRRNLLFTCVHRVGRPEYPFHKKLQSASPETIFLLLRKFDQTFSEIRLYHNLEQEPEYVQRLAQRIQLARSLAYEYVYLPKR